jgi:flagellar operon protein
MSPDPSVRVRSGAVAPVDRGPRPGATGGPGAPGFDRVLSQKLQGESAATPLRWSAHARDRLAQRQIAITPEVALRLEDAVAKAAAKGAKESLVLVDNLAFVVSITNRTVITAVDQEGLREQVFTNIDSAVLSK